MPRQRSSGGKASKAATTRPGRDAPSLVRFETLAREGLNALAKDAGAFREYLAPIAALEERHRLAYEPDERLDEYARDHGKSYLAVSRAVGAAVRDGTLDVSGAYLGGWRDEYADWFVSPQLRVCVADQPGSTADPALRYKLEWTDQQPELNFWDPIAHATRWRDQLAIASRVDGTCLVRSSTNGDQTDVQAGVGVLFRPVRRRAMFQFRALALWTSWVSISADAPPVPPPHPSATSRSYGAVRLVAQSWRASDGGDFRTDAIRDMPQWDYFVRTPDRIWEHDVSGVANPATPDGSTCLPIAVACTRSG
jgi:hypothetical protein